MNRRQSESSQKVTLQRRIDNLKQSISKIESGLYTKPLSSGPMLNLQIDAQRLADYCRYLSQLGLEG